MENESMYVRFTSKYGGKGRTALIVCTVVLVR